MEFRDTLSALPGMIVVVGILAPIIMILVLRALISARFLDDTQFEEFRKSGYAKSLSWMPTAKFLWEYQFLASILEASPHSYSRLYLIAWRGAYGAFFISAAGISILIIASVFA